MVAVEQMPATLEQLVESFDLRVLRILDLEPGATCKWHGQGTKLPQAHKTRTPMRSQRDGNDLESTTL